ncbi:MAG: hypothetical protein R3D61_11440 [Defluviimonas denitrificans]
MGSGSVWRWPARWRWTRMCFCWTKPLGALDLKLRRQMQEELKAIQRKVGTTFVHVTRD